MSVRKIDIKDFTLVDLVYDYINKNDFCTNKDIMADLDIPLSSIQYIVRTDPRIVCVGEKYTLINKVQISKDNILLIKDILSKEVKEYIHRDNIYNNNKDVLKKMNITDSLMFFHICRYYCKDEYYFFTPYIQSLKYNYAVTIKKIINDYFDLHQGIIDIEKCQREIGYITATKDFSLIYNLKNFNIKIFRMGYDRMTKLSNTSFDEITTYMILTRLNEYFDNNEYALEKDLEQLSKGLYYYVNNEKCYLNYYSLCSYVEYNLKNYHVINSLGINNYITSKYAILTNPISYLDFCYKLLREEFSGDCVSRNDVNRFLHNKNLLCSIPSNLFSKYACYTDDKIIFEK